MDAVVESGPRRIPSSFRKTYLAKLSEDDTRSEAAKIENGTQTKTCTKRKGKSSSGIINRNLIKQIIIPNHKPKKRKIKLMDWKKYHRLSVIYGFLEELEKDYPAICTVTCIGKSVEGRDIKVSLSTHRGHLLDIGLPHAASDILLVYDVVIDFLKSVSNASNTAVWLDASIHPREWITTAVLTYIADVVVKNFQNLSTSITNKDWYIVPVLNPDGYEYTHTHDRMWRKNRACYNGEYGVDLNRNFSYGWGNNGDEGSSDEPNNVFYRGPAPFSEPESAAVRDTILGSTTPFKVFLSFHSYFELIIFPWGFKRDPCRHYMRLLEGGTIMARAIYNATGMIYKVGSTKDMTYYACGTSIDWSYAIANIPYSYMIELRSKKHRFRLPKDQIPETCLEIWNAVRHLMDYVDQN